MVSDFLTIQEAVNKGEGEVKLRGWCYRERHSSKLGFIVLRDETNIIQCVVEKVNVDETTWNATKDMMIESSLEVKGTLKQDERAPTGFEISVNSINIIQLAERYPITKDQSTELLLDQRHLWIRSRKMVAILKIRHTVMHAIHKFFTNKSYILFDPPILQPTQSEGGSTVFEVKYYEDKTYLAQTWQLYAEAAVFALGKIYDVSPTFRAEKSKTSRHLSEFWMAEMEAAWMKLNEATQLAKDEIRFIIQEVLKNNEAELKILNRDSEILKQVIKKDWPTITYTKALKLLKEKKDMDVSWGKDLRTVEEEKLMTLFDTPVVVTNYPKEIMAFYKPEKKQTESDEKTPGPVALCFDMLAPEGYGEIVGGSERETDINELKKNLARIGENPKNYEWYLDLRRFGSVPHSGYGVGVERVIAWICKLDNIKDAIAFPRTIKRFTP